MDKELGLFAQRNYSTRDGQKTTKDLFFKEDLEMAGWESSNAIANEHPLVTDKRFLNTAFFPSNEEITPVMFEDLDNEN